MNEKAERKGCISCLACCATIYFFIMFCVFGVHWFRANKLYNLGEEHKENGKWDYNFVNENSESDVAFALVYYHCGVNYEPTLEAMEMTWYELE